MARRDGHEIREGAGGDDLPRPDALEGVLVGEQLGEVAEGDQRAAEHVRATADRSRLAVARQRDRERPQLGGAVLDVGDRDPRPDDERAVQCEGGDRVGGREPPAREGTLDDLESLRDPVDAGEQRPFVAGGRWRAGEVQLDLGLDARLDQVADRQARAPFPGPAWKVTMRVEGAVTVDTLRRSHARVLETRPCPLLGSPTARRTASATSGSLPSD